MTSDARCSGGGLGNSPDDVATLNVRNDVTYTSLRPEYLALPERHTTSVQRQLPTITWLRRRAADTNWGIAASNTSEHT
jgi:hypothetical protein